MAINDNGARGTNRMKRLGLWAGLMTITIAAATVFALCACKSFGR